VRFPPLGPACFLGGADSCDGGGGHPSL